MAEDYKQIIAAVMNDDGVKRAEQLGLSAIKMYQSEAAEIDKLNLPLDKQLEELKKNDSVQAAGYMESKIRGALAAALESQNIHDVDMSGNNPLANALRDAFKDKISSDLKASGTEVTAVDRQNVQDILKEKQIVTEVLGSRSMQQYEEQASSLKKALQSDYGDRQQEVKDLYFLETEARGTIANVMKNHGVTFDPGAESGLSRDVTVALQVRLDNNASPDADRPFGEKDKQNIDKVTADLAAYNEAHRDAYAKPVTAKPAGKQQMDGPA